MIVQLAQRFDISTDELLTGQTSHPYKREESQSYPEHLNFGISYLKSGGSY